MAKKKFDLNEITIGGLKQAELTSFTRQFATLINAGLTTIRALEILAKMLKPGVLKKALYRVAEDVERGTTLSNAMAQHPKVFDDLYRNMVRAGEAGGILDGILNRLADFREKSQKIAREIKSAMIYPIAVLSIAIIIVTGIIIMIVPQFQKIFADFDIDLPGLTILLLNTADLLTNEWHKPLIAIAVLVIAFFTIKHFEKGRYYMDYAKLYMPIFGQIVRKSAISRFCRTLGTLLESGVPLVEGLQILKGAAGNAVVGAIISQIEASVKQGDPMTKPLRQSRVFDEMTVSMIEVGDEAGEVPQMLVKISDNFDNEVDALVTGMKSLIEPLLIVGLGLVVGFIVIALFMPLIQLMEKLS